jgi:hypothetical protein
MINRMYGMIPSAKIETGKRATGNIEQAEDAAPLRLNTRRAPTR